ncbi:MAG: hypothetical protein K2Q22_00105, partial [Cytophagales bacterium]|nr:hypothetical protein [Cytophagales bacterium]
KKYSDKNRDELGYPFIQSYISLNPKSYLPYWYAGDYFNEKGEYPLAVENYRRALQQNIPTRNEYDAIKERMTKAQNHKK